jgi:hypothetical protein
MLCDKDDKGKGFVAEREFVDKKALGSSFSSGNGCHAVITIFVLRMTIISARVNETCRP